MLSPFRELPDFPVDHTLGAVRQMVAVAPMDGQTLNAFALELARIRAGAVFHSASFDLRKEFVLQIACLFGLALFGRFHFLNFHEVVIDLHR